MSGLNRAGAPTRLALESIVLLAASVIALLPLASAVRPGAWTAWCIGTVLVVTGVGVIGRQIGAARSNLYVAQLLAGLLVAGACAWSELGSFAAVHPEELDGLQVALVETRDVIAFGRMPIDSTAGLDVMLVLGTTVLATALWMVALSGSPAWGGLVLLVPWLALLPSDLRLSVPAFAAEAVAFLALLVTFSRPRAFPSYRHALHATRRSASAPGHTGTLRRLLAAGLCAALLLPFALTLADHAPSWRPWRTSGELSRVVRGWFGPHIGSKLNVAGARTKDAPDVIGTLRRASASWSGDPGVVRAYTTTGFDGREWQLADGGPALTSEAGTIQLVSQADSMPGQLVQYELDLPHGAPGYLLLPTDSVEVDQLQDSWRYYLATDTAVPVNVGSRAVSYRATALAPDEAQLEWANARVTADGSAWRSTSAIEFEAKVKALPPIAKPKTNALARLEKLTGRLNVWGNSETDALLADPPNRFSRLSFTSARGVFFDIDERGKVEYQGAGMVFSYNDDEGVGLSVAEERKVSAFLRDRRNVADLLAEGQYEARTSLAEYAASSMSGANQGGASPFGADAITVPPSVDRRVGELAKEATRGATSDYGRALAIQEYLRSGDYVYDDEIPAVAGGTDPVGSFLDTKRGYCLQFATLMTMMTRSLGMPTRLATGYLVTREAKDSWQITADKAHAWPEIYFDTVGWVRFEPTPSSQSGTPPVWALPEPSATPSKTATPRPTATANPSPTARGPRLEPSQRPNAGEIQAPGRSVPGWVLGGAIGLCVLLAVGGALVAWRRGLLTWPPPWRASPTPLEAAWRQVVAAAATRGIDFPASTTLADQARGLGPQLRDGRGVTAVEGRAALAQLADALQSERYGVTTDEPSGPSAPTRPPIRTWARQVVAALPAGRRVTRPAAGDARRR